MLKIFIKAEARYPLERKEIRKRAVEVLKNHGLREGAAANINVVGDRKMTALNQKYLKRKGTTDVLSFPAGEGSFVFPPDGVLHLGDIVISFPQARRQAIEYNRTVDEEINTLVEHGLLHLLGINHKEEG